MTIQNFCLELGYYLNVCVMYFGMLLGRSVFLSLPVLLVVLLLRRTVFKKTIFIKGMLWCLFLPLPFVGKMRFFYESRIGVRGFLWWHNLCVEQQWVCWIYLLGMVAFGIYIFYRRRNLYRFAVHLRKEQVGDMELSICDRAVTPFTVGVLHPRIVVPELIQKDFHERELQLILLHEKTHIRLGHLWWYAVWDLLRVLLWVNPFLTVCTKYLREDLEEICDRVVIQRSKETAYDYGRLLLNSIRLLGAENIDTPITFAGEREYQSIKNRMERVAHFKPYKRTSAVLASFGGIFIAVGLFFGIRQLSYPVYMERTDVSVYNMKLQSWDIGDQSQLRDVFFLDNGCVCLRKEAWNEILQEQGIEAGDYYICFGGYMKMPGIGGGGNAIYVDGQGEGDLLVIPYYDNDAVLWSRLFKLL